MNRHFFQAEEEETFKQEKCSEVELITDYMKEHLLDTKRRLAMFLDVHAHSSKRGIFAFAPQASDTEDVGRTH